VIVLDNSAGHRSKAAGSLAVTGMNVGVGGKQRMMNPTIVDVQALHPAILYKNGDLWSATPKAGYVAVDCKVQPGETQAYIFGPGSPPPFFDTERPYGTYHEKTRATKR
jgi:hypothetical protein